MKRGKRDQMLRGYFSTGIDIIPFGLDVAQAFLISSVASDRLLYFKLSCFIVFPE